MTFLHEVADGKNRGGILRRLGLSAVAVMCLSQGAAFAGPEYAIVPTQTIYPGQEIAASQIKPVEVTNPNIVSGYARTVSEVSGMVTTRTLLPGRVILMSSLREPYAVKRGENALMIYNNGSLVISASGVPLQDGAVGDLIRIRNKDTGVIVSGTIMSDGSIQVVAK